MLLWGSYFTSLRLGFIIGKMRLITPALTGLLRVLDRIRKNVEQLLSVSEND